MSLQGVLSKYKAGPHKHYPYFRSGDLDAKRVVMFIGGLTNGLMDPGYLVGLSGDLKEAEWGLVQMHWSGAYYGFATGDLERDRDEMSALVMHLRNEGIKTIILMGHSTGSQNVIHYLSSPSSSTLPPVQGGIMQAPCSDRQYFEKDERERISQGKGPSEEFEKIEEGWKAVEEGRGGEVLIRDFVGMGCGITGRRLVDLCAVGGNDDYFSDDVPLHNPQPPTLPHPHAHPLSTSFGNLSAPALALWSEHDEYGVQPDREGLNARWVDAGKGMLEVVVIKGEGANHAVDGEEERKQLGRSVVGWLKGFT